MVTQSGGLSSDNSVPLAYKNDPQNYTACGVKIGAAYFDPCHEPNKANYALDFASSDATVVAAKGGTIVQLHGDNSLGAGVVNKCDIVNCIVIKDSDGLYEEYREFSSLSSNSDGSPFYVGEQITAAQPLGTLQNGNGAHLHFQVEDLVNGQLNSKSCTYVPDDCSPILQKVTVGGRLFKDYKLGGNGQATYNKDGSLNSLMGTPTAAQIYGQIDPALPTTTDPTSKAFDFNVVIGDLGVGKDLPIYVDPAAAIGYDYQVLSGPNFASVVLPDVGGGLFDLSLYDPILSDWYFNQTLTAGTQFFFGSGGVDRFRILGIDPSAGLDPSDPNAFITGLTFTEPGAVNFTMTAIPAAVDEPGSAALLAAALVVLGFVRLSSPRARLPSA